MVSNFNVQVSFHGPLFAGNAGEAARHAAKEQLIDKVVERWIRPGGRGLGRRRNTLRLMSRGVLEAEVSSTLHHPRRSRKATGAWTTKQMRIYRAMAPRVLRATQRRIVQELGG